MGLSLESPSYNQGEMIPSKFTCDGVNVSPSLKWTGVPDGTETFALIFDDPDAPAKTWVHWVLFNIPGDKTTIVENIPSDKKLTDGSVHGMNDFKKIGYRGPCPPGDTHRYFMKLYALDSELNLEPGASKNELLDAMEEHIIEEAELMGRFKRQ